MHINSYLKEWALQTLSLLHVWLNINLYMKERALHILSLLCVWLNINLYLKEMGTLGCIPSAIAVLYNVDLFLPKPHPWGITACPDSNSIIITTQIAKFMEPTWSPPGSYWPQMGPMLAPWTLLSGHLWSEHCTTRGHKNTVHVDKSVWWHHKSKPLCDYICRWYGLSATLLMLDDRIWWNNVVHRNQWVRCMLLMEMNHGLLQERCNSSALAIDLHIFCTNPSKYNFTTI